MDDDAWVADDHPDRDYYCEGCDQHFPRSDGLTYPPDPRIWCPQCSDACEPFSEEEPMPPIPDPPPAAPLTAEEITKLRDSRDWWRKKAQSICGWWVEAVEKSDALGAETAALRDRLARAEARNGELEKAIAAMVDGPPDNSCSSVVAPHLIGYTEYVDWVYATARAALAAPTDGAARAGDAAGDGGGAT